MLEKVTPRKGDIVEYIATFDVLKYRKTRNHVQGGVSKLSPYITRGVISLPEIRDIILENNALADADKFIQELTWREYWQQVWYAKGNAIFSDMRFPRDDWEHTDLVSSIVTATTGIEVIDRSVLELKECGYMHNHARMWTAMLACNVAKAHWYEMSRWLYYHLFDGDLASNVLSWQWVAGTNSSKRYVANQKLINACSDVSQAYTFLTMPREDVGEGEIPVELREKVSYQYKTTYPQSDLVDFKTETLLLYSPWTLDPDWRTKESGERVLVIEPRWFDRFPVSDKVMNFILTVARIQIPGCKIWVGNVSDLDLSKETRVFSKSYPAHTDWPGEQDKPDRLFPHVTGYYPSFFKFWKACQA